MPPTLVVKLGTPNAPASQKMWPKHSARDGTIAVARESALPEMAADAAVYFDPYNAGAMAEVLDRLVWDESLRDDLRRRAMARAAAFSWTETARKTMAVFERVAGFDNEKKVGQVPNLSGTRRFNW